MIAIYVDADACPVKDEVYSVAARYDLRVFVVANARMGVPSGSASNSSSWTAASMRPTTGSPSARAAATW